MEDTKRCSGCDADKPRAEFYRHRSQVDGLQRQCKECDDKRTRRRAAANPEASRRRNRKWRAAHVDAQRERVRRYHAANPEQVRERHRKRRATNPEVHRARLAKRRARQRSNTVALTPTDRAAVALVYAEAAFSSAFRLDAGLSPAHVDHRQPLALGGAHLAVNLQTLSAELNLAKQTMTHAEALERVPGYREWCEGPDEFEPAVGPGAKQADAS